MLAVQFHMKRLENLCINYLESSINHRNVLIALKNADQLRLFVIKEFCLRLIFKDVLSGPPLLCLQVGHICILMEQKAHLLMTCYR